MDNIDTPPDVKVYRKLDEGEQIIIAADPAEVNDFCAAVAVSKKQLDFPIVYNAVTDSAQFGYDVYNLAKYVFNKTQMWPKVAIERNVGMATIMVLKQLNYPDLFRMIDPVAQSSQEKGGIGWNTTGHWSGGEIQGTRRKMLDDMALAIKQGKVKMYDEQQIKQFKSFVNYRGRGQARSNKKDDLVVASCIAWQVQDITPTMYLDDFDQEEFKKEKEKFRFK